MDEQNQAGAAADQAEAALVDLFGQPVLPIRERRGRPSFAKTVENQRAVELRAAAGWSAEAIAADIGCHVDTLRKHFSGELQNAALKIEGEMLDILYQRARQGHVPSVRELRDQVKTVAPRKPVEKDAAKAPALGKKAQRLRDAAERPAEYGDILDRLPH